MPQTQDKPTKQRILDVATDLFAQSGFKDVSMREIAQAVGIKASSLYKHFEGKEGILESIFEIFRDRLSAAEMTGQMPQLSSPADYFSLAFDKFKQVMWQPDVIKIARIITVEQQRSQSVREFLVQEMIEKPVMGTQYVLDIMKNDGLIRDIDTRVLAEEYCAYIVYLYFEQNFLHTGPSLDVIDEKMRQHNDFFVRNILKQGE